MMKKLIGVSDPYGQYTVKKTLEGLSDAFRFNGWMYDAIAPFCKGELLEVGGGIGNLSRYLIDHSSRVTLSDIDESFCRILEQRFGRHPSLARVMKLDLGLPGASGSLGKELFDTVIALNVIEHIQDDGLAVRNAASMLRPDGNLVVLVPAHAWLYNRLDKELGHFRRYSKKELIRLVEGAGLRVTHIRYFNGMAIPAWWVSGMLRLTRISAGMSAGYDRLTPLARLTDKLTGNRMGLSLIVTASKQNSEQNRLI